MSYNSFTDIDVCTSSRQRYRVIHNPDTGEGKLIQWSLRWSIKGRNYPIDSEPSYPLRSFKQSAGITLAEFYEDELIMPAPPNPHGYKYIAVRHVQTSHFNGDRLVDGPVQSEALWCYEGKPKSEPKLAAQIQE